MGKTQICLCWHKYRQIIIYCLIILFASTSIFTNIVFTAEGRAISNLIEVAQKGMKDRGFVMVVKAQIRSKRPPGAVEVRLQRSLRRKSRYERDNGASSSSAQSAKVKGPPKKWEDMNLTEKAIELYVGDKGALFWLNKFPYASSSILNISS